MTAYYAGALCALIASRAATLAADGRVMADLRLWLYVGAAAVLMASCIDPVPALGY